MKMYDIYMVHTFTEHTFLGRVNADCVPDAILKAIDKWKIKSVGEQRKLLARKKGVPVLSTSEDRR